MIGRLVKLIIAIFFYAGLKIYFIQFLLRGKNIPPLLVIITYHPVKASQTAFFEKQMNMLLTSGTPVALTEIGKLKGGFNVAVTFDDAYQSVLQNALPILCMKNIPAAIFVPTGYLGKKPEWIKNTRHPYADDTVMTSEQLKTLPADLITIGSHTASHVRLSNLETIAIQKEIFGSKQVLEEIVNREITLFAAPYATLDEKYAPLFKEAGYERVFLNIPTFPATNTTLYILGRTGVEPTDWPLEFRLKLKGAYQWLPLAINLKKRLLG